MGINKRLLRVVPNVVGYRLRMDGRVLELSAEVFIASQSDVKCYAYNAVVLCGCYESEIALIFSTRPRNFVHRNYHDTTFSFSSKLI
jgi:hypothetical protein